MKLEYNSLCGQYKYIVVLIEGDLIEITTNFNWSPGSYNRGNISIFNGKIMWGRDNILQLTDDCKHYIEKLVKMKAFI